MFFSVCVCVDTKALNGDSGGNKLGKGNHAVLNN